MPQRTQRLEADEGCLARGLSPGGRVIASARHARGGARIGRWPSTFASGSRTATFRHVTLLQNETHTQWAAREFGAESRWAQTVEGTLVAKASIVEVSLVELDEQPTLDGVLPAQAASAEARARARIFE
jgi:hypothetical protein